MEEGSIENNYRVYCGCSEQSDVDVDSWIGGAPWALSEELPVQRFLKLSATFCKFAVLLV